MTPELLLAPSVLSADFSKIAEQLKAVETNGADWVHLDVMDGHFVPNITFGPLIIEGIQRATNLFLDAHLMVSNPEMFIEEFAKVGVKNITVHQEAVKHLDVMIHKIKNLGCTAGVSLNPATPVHLLDDILPELDLVLIMTVNPGFGGQKFIPYTLDKIRTLREKINALGKEIHIQVDGGIKPGNVQEVISAGANVIVAGSAITGAPDVAKACAEFKQAMNPAV